MSLISGKARGFAAASALAAIVSASPIGPALAGDDGQEPIWTGIGDLLGLTDKKVDPHIDYWERARLVLPPKMALPQPLPPVAQRTAAWPVDQETVKARKAKEEAVKSLLDQSNFQKRRDAPVVPFEQLRVDRSTPTESADKQHCQSQTNVRRCTWAPFRNVFEAVGLAKPDEIVAGQEPDRDWLTDPPKGYRVPVSTTVATPDDTKKPPDPHDPRSLLYHAPDQ